MLATDMLAGQSRAL